MADWRQIQARIRRAKASPDALAKLSDLFQRTRDAMVAWEIGVIEEKGGNTDEAAKWYATALKRFRRADWKKKAEEALTRLGVAIPFESAEAPTAEPDHAPTAHPPSDEAEDVSRLTLAHGEIPEEQEKEAAAPSELPARVTATGTAEDGQKKRRRGRRGGRGRRRKGAAAAPGLPNQAFTEHVESKQQPSRIATFEPPSPALDRRGPSRSIYSEPPVPMLPSERTAHGRAGDPALASRMAQLESMLRRLVASPLHRLEEADQAPAGPGVFLLSDSDQISSYYVEACQTLRVGVGNMARGGHAGKSRGSRSYPSESGLKAKLAEHLGISESKVSQYLKDHCVVRWIQLDDDASHLAHFAIGVLRTPLNVD